VERALTQQSDHSIYLLLIIVDESKSPHSVSAPLPQLAHALKVTFPKGRDLERVDERQDTRRKVSMNRVQRLVILLLLDGIKLKNKEVGAVLFSKSGLTKMDGGWWGGGRRDGSRLETIQILVQGCTGFLRVCF
jgi:hypothetical protein